MANKIRFGAKSDVNIIFGVVKSNHRYFPIVNGILFLKKKGSKQAVDSILHQNYSKAMDHVLDFPRGINRVAKLTKPFGPLEAILKIFGLKSVQPNWLLYLLQLDFQHQKWARYLLNRKNSHTFSNSLMTLSFLKPGITLDIGCGIGQFLPHLRHKVGQFNTLAIDNSFWNLYLASFSNQNTSLLCVDIIFGFPFKNSTVTNITCNDTFHFLKKKKYICEELQRIINRKGLILFNHVNQKVKELSTSGYPISAKKLSNYFINYNKLLLPESIRKQMVLPKGKLKLFKELGDLKNLNSVQSALSFSAIFLKN